MKKSTTSLVFPDINVWVALTVRTHQHSAVAWKWYHSLPEQVDLVFCRLTQLGLLRILSQKGVAGLETMNQLEAWAAYDRWLDEGGAVFHDEPFGIEIEFRSFANLGTPAPKHWADSYLAAFAACTSMPLVTFDKLLGVRSPRSILLRPDLVVG